MSFIIAEPDPEEIERAHASHLAGAHAVNRLLDELTEEQFLAISLMFDAISNADNPTRTAAYLSGRIVQARQARFNLCAACGKDHDKEAEELLSPSADAKSEVPPFVKARESSAEIHFLPIGTRGPLTVPERELMTEYNLDDLRDEESHKLLGFMCLNCGMRYQSIQDRMIKPPGEENCDGCIQKTRWG